jgi:hypothetical protein
MKVSVKDLAISMELGNNGIELDVYGNQGNHLGDLCVGRGTVELCKGRTHRGNGKQVSWEQLIEWFESR